MPWETLRTSRGDAHVDAAPAGTAHEARPTRPDAKRSASDPVAAPAAIHLDTAEPTPSGVTLQVSAFDSAGARTLVLHELHPSGRTRPIARAWSDADGRASFSDVVRRQAEMTVVATPEGGDPFGPSASSPLIVEPSDPSPPAIVGLEPIPDGFVVRARTGGAGELLLADADEHVIARFSTAPAPRPGADALEIQVTPTAGESEFLIAFESPDGRRSDWRAIEAPQSIKENVDVDPEEI